MFCYDNFRRRFIFRRRTLDRRTTAFLVFVVVRIERIEELLTSHQRSRWSGSRSFNGDRSARFDAARSELAERSAHRACSVRSQLPAQSRRRLAARTRQTFCVNRKSFARRSGDDRVEVCRKSRQRRRRKLRKLSRSVTFRIFFADGRRPHSTICVPVATAIDVLGARRQTGEVGTQLVEVCDNAEFVWHRQQNHVRRFNYLRYSERLGNVER